MARLIKRYGSRKLYDTEESRYVSLEDLAAWVREGQELEVIDNASSENVTVATLTQVISEEGRKGNTLLPSDLLHNLIRIGGQAVTSRVKKFQSGVDRLVKTSIDSIVPVSGVREEMEMLRKRLDELEQALNQPMHVDKAAATEQKPIEQEMQVEKASIETKTPAVKKATTSKKAAPKTTARKKTTATRARKTTTAAKPKSKTVKSSAKAAATTSKADQGATS